jgi:hypothetical protein
MQGFLLRGGLEISMTGQTDDRQGLSQQDCRDGPVGKMAGLTILLFGRLMNNTGLKSGGLLWMTLGTSAAHLRFATFRGRAASHDDENQAEANQAKFP